MRYRTIHKSHEDFLIHELNKCVNEGYRVISAGASFNAARGGLEWWAVIERDETAQETPKTPKDEAAELLEAARKIKAYCNAADCCNCPFLTGLGYCELTANAPNCWGLPEKEG